jgi:opacity protein-like surface antigen
MRHFSLGLVAATVLSSAAVAADLPVKAFAPLPPQPSWSGFYVGLNGGYSFGSASYSQAGGFTSTAFGSNFPLYSAGHNSLKGALAGGQAGYNWQVSNRWLFGLEADWQWSGQRGDNRNCTPLRRCRSSAPVPTASATASQANNESPTSARRVCAPAPSCATASGT